MLTVCMICWTGCRSQPIVFRPIAGDHLVGMTNASGRVGYFVSTNYMERVLRVRVEKSDL